MKSSTQLRRQLLISLGLSDKESILYETLLKYGTLPASTLEKYSGLKKNTYTILKSLERRSLVHKFIKDSRSHYQVGSPTQLKTYLMDRKQEVDEAVTLFNDTLPSLLNDYKKVLDSPIVSHYQGKSGLREVLELTYKPDKKEIYGCVGWGKATPTLDEVLHKYSHARIERGIYTYALNSNTEGGKAFKDRSRDPKSLSEVYLLDPKLYPMPAEIDVWNNLISLFSFENNDFQAIIIDHPEFATTLKSIFKLLFKLLRDQEQSKA